MDPRVSSSSRIVKLVMRLGSKREVQYTVLSRYKDGVSNLTQAQFTVSSILLDRKIKRRETDSTSRCEVTRGSEPSP